MKKYLFNIVSVLFLLVVLPPVGVRAASGDGFRLDEKGVVTVVSQHAAGEEISSLGFSLNVVPEQGALVDFQFEGSNAKVLEYRYDQAAQKLNIYVAGTEALFAEGTDALTIGRVTVRDESGRETAAQVSVVEDSLQYVYGTETRTMQGIELPGTVQINAAGTTPTVTPPAVTPPPVPDSEGTEEPEDESTPQTPAPTRPPAPAQTQKPAVQQPGATQRPQPTSVPVRPLDAKEVLDDSMSRTLKTVIQSFGSRRPENTPEKEDGFIFSKSPENEDTDLESESQGWNVLLVVVIIVIVIVVIVEAAAFIVVKRKPKR